MSELLLWLKQIFASWKVWVVVSPWDVGIRVRLGRSAIELRPGPHLRIPFLDQITIVNTRVRILSTPPVTIASDDCRVARVRATTVTIRIVDPLRAIMAYSSAGDVILGLAFAESARLTTADECLTSLRLKTAGNGIEIIDLVFTEDASARCIRLVDGRNNGSWAGHGGETPAGMARF